MSTYLINISARSSTNSSQSTLRTSPLHNAKEPALCPAKAVCKKRGNWETINTLKSMIHTQMLQKPLYNAVLISLMYACIHFAVPLFLQTP